MNRGSADGRLDAVEDDDEQGFASSALEMDTPACLASTSAIGFAGR